MKLFDRIFKNSVKEVPLYVVSDTDLSMEEGVPKEFKVYTVTSTLEDSQEYYNALCKIKNKSHFDLWCGCHDEDKESEESWFRYAQSVLSEKEPDFYINVLYYDVSKIALVFRMFNGCTPIGCSFESDVEYKYFVEKLDPNVREQIERDLEAFKQDI